MVLMFMSEDNCIEPIDPGAQHLHSEIWTCIDNERDAISFDVD